MVASCRTFVLALIAAIRASPMAAPVGSVTRPASEALGDCARTDDAIDTMMRNARPLAHRNMWTVGNICDQYHESGVRRSESRACLEPELPPPQRERAHEQTNLAVPLSVALAARAFAVDDSANTARSAARGHAQIRRVIGGLRVKS